MTRRALLIGSQTSGLSGVDTDLELMTETLINRGFTDIRHCPSADATRDGILRAAKHLTDATDHDDVVVLYYSGHGGRLLRPDADRRRLAGLDPYLQFIVPTDLDDSSEDDFRGILADELSAYQRQLTSRTPNVVTVLDCCHSAAMAARDLRYLPKAVHRDLPVAGALARLEAVSTGPAGMVDPGRSGLTVGNLLAVRVVACEIDRVAYEGPARGGGRAGVLTDAFVAALTEIGDRPLTWDALLRRVRDDMAVRCLLNQRPAVEGPIRRFLFTTERISQADALPIVRREHRWVVEGGAFIGLGPGDAVRILDRDGADLGAATVTGMDRADVDLDFQSEELPSGALAAVARSCVTRPVRVDAAEPAGPRLRDHIAATPGLRVADSSEPVFAAVVGSASSVTVLDAAGRRVRTQEFSTDPTSIDAVVDLLGVIAFGDRMRLLQGSNNDPYPKGLAAEVTFFLHDEGEKTRELRLSGDMLYPGDRLSVRVRNASSKRSYVWLFDIGASGRTTLVSNDLHAGRPLEPAGMPGDTWTIGEDRLIDIDWPPDVPTDDARTESLLLVVADRSLDLSSLERRDGLGARPSRPRIPDELTALISEVDTGVREARLEAVGMRYVTYRLDVTLTPTVRPRLHEPPFEIDDRPDPSMRIWRPRSSASVPDTVALRLVELRVIRNRALFRADVRLDWLVVTEGPDGPRAQAGTQRFPRIADGTVLPAENIRLWSGNVREYLDIALWVSRDDRKGLDLLELFQRHTGDAAVQAELAAVLGLAVAAPQAALAVGTVAAVATLVRVAGELVAAATGKHIGLYRTSLLAVDRFGLGRTPPHGRKRAQDVEFAIDVVEL